LSHRLKTTLNLPSIEPRPPCPPKIYKKLYGHFDQILTSSSLRRQKTKTSNPPTPAKALPQKQIPAKEKSLEGFRSNRTPKPGLKYGSNKQERLPRWIGPAIRKICLEFDAGKAVPHVWAGVESVLFLPCPKDLASQKGVKESDKMEGKIPALVGTIFFYVFAALEDRQTNKKELFEEKKRVLKILCGLKADGAVVSKVGEGDEGWLGWEIVAMKDMNVWISEIVEKGWLEMEWRSNVVDGSGASGRVEEIGDWEVEVDVEEEDDEVMERASRRMRRTGLGTMMQPKFEYLSDDKREEYAMWKEAMLVKINGLIAEGIMNDEMDTAEG
jgi:origin recognition complex subunit 6